MSISDCSSTALLLSANQMGEEGWSSCDATDLCGSRLLHSLPDDVLSIISTSLLPRDLCNLSLCCRSLRSLALSDKLWFVQCSITEQLHPRDLLKWRSSLSSYRALCRFLVSARPLLGIWVNPYPKYGSFVFVTLGFLSVVACRVIPKPRSSCIDPSPLLWAPVFEITARPDGSMQFFLHGHEGNSDFLHPGSVNSIDPNCNILFLEVEPCQFVSCPPPPPPPPPPLAMPFNGLDLEDEQMLLELVADQVRLKLPDSLNGCFPLFYPQSTDEEGEAGGGDLGLLEERRSYLINMYNNLRWGVVNWQLLPGLSSDGSQIAKRILDRLTSFASNCNENCAATTTTTTNTTATKRKTVARIFMDGIKQAFGRSNCRNETSIFSTSRTRERESKQAFARSNCRNETSIFSTSRTRERESKQAFGRSNCRNETSIFSENENGTSRNRVRESEQAFGSSNCRNETSIKRDDLQEFLQVSDTIRLSISGFSVGCFYPGVWPSSTHDYRYALYKLPFRITTVGEEDGLWGGSFGWPPGRRTEDEPITALDIFFISYKERRGRPTIFAAKIIGSSHYDKHYDGDIELTVKLDKPSLEPFPWDVDGNSVPIEIEEAYSGKAWANTVFHHYSYGMPGTMFVMRNGLLAFVWKESREVLTLRQMDLQQLLKKGNRVPTLPSITNFRYFNC